MAQLQLEFARGDVIADKYEVVDRLDEGPLGIHYRVRHLKHGTYVRLLMLDPRVAGKEHKDALIAAFKKGRGIEHKRVLKPGELSQHGGVAFVTMEDFEGDSLRVLIEKVRGADAEFSLREAAQIAIQAAEAATLLHDVDGPVRALRPEHLVVTMRRAGPGGRNVIIDVRLVAPALWSLVPDGVLAEEEFTRGEGQYLAPEVKQPDAEVTPRSDVYSLGVMFYELLLGVPPVGTYQLPRQRRPDLPKHVDDVVELALAPAASDRYPTPADFAADVKRCFQGLDEDDEVPTKVNWLGWALGALLAAAVIALVVQQSSVDPFEASLAADNTLRKEVYEKHARPSPDEVRAILAEHPPNMMYIPGGPFVKGRLAHEPKDVGGQRATVVEVDPYLIDVFEYPNLNGAPPQYGVTFKEASQLCVDAGKRLCTADEFEKACRGPENYVYSYGDTFDIDFCGTGVHTAGQFPECKSSWGVYDISGNFREWTSTPRGDGRVLVKGGLPSSAERGTRCAYATDLSTSYTDETIGFRCCRDVNAPPPPAAEADAE